MHRTGGIVHMDEFISTHEVAIRLGFFFGIFLVMALREVAAPRRDLTQSKARRWMNNIGLLDILLTIFRTDGNRHFSLTSAVPITIQRNRR